jgi:hypothetical protein
MFEKSRITINPRKKFGMRKFEEVNIKYGRYILGTVFYLPVRDAQDRPYYRTSLHLDLDRVEKVLKVACDNDAIDSWITSDLGRRVTFSDTLPNVDEIATALELVIL